MRKQNGKTNKNWSSQSVNPWVLTFAGGAPFPELRPASSTGADVPEYSGVNRIAVNREIRATVRRAKALGGLEQLIAEQACRGVQQAKIPAGIDAVEFVRYRLSLLLFLAHRTKAGAGKRALRPLLRHQGQYTFPLPPAPTKSLQRSTVSQAPKVETVDEFLDRGGVIKVFARGACSSAKPIANVQRRSTRQVLTQLAA